MIKGLYLRFLVYFFPRQEATKHNTVNINTKNIW